MTASALTGAQLQLEALEHVDVVLAGPAVAVAEVPGRDGDASGRSGHARSSAVESSRMPAAKSMRGA